LSLTIAAPAFAGRPEFAQFSDAGAVASGLENMWDP